MAAELQVDYLTGKTVYFLLRNSVGQVWNGSAFEAYQTANLGNYDIAAAEQGTASGFYVGDMPSVAAGTYGVVAKERAGGSPAEVDVSVGHGTLEWGGSAVIDVNAVADALLKRDVDNVEASAAVHSLCSAILKLVSKFDVTTGANAITYRTDGTTQHMVQAKTTNASLTPVQTLGVGA